MSGRDDRESYFVQSLERGLAVITAFDEKHPRLTLTEVAQRTALTRASARRFLLTLVDLDYIASDGKYFWLTPGVTRLGYAYIGSLSFLEAAEPHLRRLSDATGESASLSVLDGDEVVYVARMSSHRIMKTNLNVGTRLPAHAASMGRVLLAGLSPRELEEYLARSHRAQLTTYTTVDRDELRTAIGVAREQGWSGLHEELELGLCSLAAPVLDRNGQVVAAANVSFRPQTPASFEGHGQHEEFLAELLAATSAITADLQHLPD